MQNLELKKLENVQTFQISENKTNSCSFFFENIFKNESNVVSLTKKKTKMN